MNNYPNIHIKGLKRSGNHVIINWLNSLNTFIFFNNIYPIKKYGIGNYQSISKTRLLMQRIVIQCIKLNNIQPLTDYYTKPSIFSYEDIHPDFDPIKIRGDERKILVIRSLENIFASRIKKGSVRQTDGVYPSELNAKMYDDLELWKQYARRGVNQFKQDSEVIIYFDSWLVNESQRMKLSRQLDLDLPKSPPQSMSHFGGGSSFTGLEVIGKHDKSVLRRSSGLNLEERKMLKHLISDNEAKELQLELKAKYS